MAPTKERQIRRYAKGYERRSGAAAYIPSGDLQSFCRRLCRSLPGYASDHSPVRYSLTLENRDIVLDFGK